MFSNCVVPWGTGELSAREVLRGGFPRTNRPCHPEHDKSVLYRQRWHHSASREGIVIHQKTGGTLDWTSARAILISPLVPADQLHNESSPETNFFHWEKFQPGYISRIQYYRRVPGETSDTAEYVQTSHYEARSEQLSEDLKLAGDQEEAEPPSLPCRWLRWAVQASIDPKVVAAISRKEKALSIEDQWLSVNYSFTKYEAARNYLNLSATWFQRFKCKKEVLQL